MTYPRDLIIIPWTYTMYFYDKDWKEIDELRRHNTSVKDIDAVLCSLMAVQRDPRHAQTAWQEQLLEVAAVTLEVNNGRA